MVQVPTLTDGVVTLRAHRDEDVDRCVEQSTDPVSVEWTTVPVPYTRDDAKRFVRDAMPGGWATDEEWAFAVEHEGRYSGTISLRNRGDRRAEIAYGSHPDVRGKGVMERALRLLLEWGFATEADGGRDLLTVVWWANQGNWASRKLAWRLGFSFDGTVRRWLPHRGELLDAWVGVLLRDDPREPSYAWLDVPLVELDGLRLRPLQERDAPRVVEGCNDQESRRWMPRMPDPYGEAEARTWIQGSTDRAARGEGLTWAVADRIDDRLLGAVQLFGMSPREAGTAELGYWVHPDARGRGVAVAASRAAIRHAFVPVEDGGLGLRRVYAVVGAANAASLAVVRTAGMHQVGVERAGFESGDAVQFDVLTDEVTDELADQVTDGITAARVGPERP